MDINIIFFYSILLMIPSAVIIYFCLPKISCRIGKQKYRNNFENPLEKIFIKYFNKIPIPEKLKEHTISKVHESGNGDNNTWIYWLGLTSVLPVILFILLTLQQYSIGVKIALCSLCLVMPNIYLEGRIARRKRAFIINAYKLYYFMHSQISSGVKVTDAIKGIYEIADHPLIQKTFIQFVAQYELTLNIEDSLQVLRKSFSGYDCEMLCVSIQQCINTGMAGKTLLKMEQMMFSKYFYYLQKDTEKFKTKLFISGIFAIVPIIMIFLFPVLFDAMKAFEKIMQSQ